MTKTSIIVGLLVAAAAMLHQPAQAQFLFPSGKTETASPSSADLLRTILQSFTSGSDAERLEAVERVSTLGSFGSKTLTAELVKLLDDDNSYIRHAALHALAGLGRSASSSLPAIRSRIDEAAGRYERTLAAWTATQVAADPRQLDDLIPALLEALAADDPAINSYALQALSALGRIAHQKLTAALSESDSATSHLIIEILGETGARDSIDAIAQRLKSDEPGLRAAAAEALGRIGPASRVATSDLISRLNSDGDDAARLQSARALGRIGERSEAVTQALSKSATTDRRDAVAAASIDSLEELNTPPEIMLTVLPELLTDNRVLVVTAAMSALKRQGSKSVPTLKKALQDKRSRDWALLVIADLGPVARETIPVLSNLLDDDDSVTRRETLMAIAKIGPAAADTTSQIARQLSDENSGVQYAATFAAGSVGVKDPSLIAGLNANTGSDDAMLRLLSSWALARLDPGPLVQLRAVRELAGGITSKSPDLRLAAVQCLATLSPGAAQLPLLVKNAVDAFKSESQNIRQNAIDALTAALDRADVEQLLEPVIANEASRPIGAVVAARLGPRAESLTPTLVEALSDSRPAVRRDVGLALAAIGTPASDSAEPLTRVLGEDTDADARRAAAFALGSIRSSKPTVIKSLIGALTDESVRSTAAWSLAQLAPDNDEVAAATIPQLINDLNSPLAGERLNAALAVSRFGSAAVAARPALEYASDDPDLAVRTAARTALESISAE